jgi:hypothetical protein
VIARVAALVCLVLVVGCSGDDEPEARPSVRASAAVATRSAAPATKKPVASPTASPPPKPVPMSVAGAFLKPVRGGQSVAADPQNGCFDAYPGLLDVSCDEIRLDGGTVLWVAGTEDRGDGQRRRVLRLHTFDAPAGGYVLRFEARDPAGGWTGFKLGAAPLTGHGVDALVAQTTLAGNGASYDVFTWRAGGPLVLRAHRAPGRDVRVAARDQRIDDYQVSDNPRFYRYRRITWDGAKLVIADYGRVRAGDVPPPN